MSKTRKKELVYDLERAARRLYEARANLQVFPDKEAYIDFNSAKDSLIAAAFALQEYIERIKEA